jgi:hypothetical protein
MDYTKSQCLTFVSEKDANEFLRSGRVGYLISIVPKMSHFVVFFIPKDEIKIEMAQTEVKQKKK